MGFPEIALEDLAGSRLRERVGAELDRPQRVKDIIIRGGENVPVKEIEDLLVRHLKIRTDELSRASKAQASAGTGAVAIGALSALLTTPEVRGGVNAFVQGRSLDFGSHR